MLDLYIRTRGTTIDYSFLLKEPIIQDSNDYKSDIEKPTCILEQTVENNGYLFLSGIPSKRKDRQGTPLRYDLVVRFNSANWVDGGDGSVEWENYLTGLTNLIWMWLKEVRAALQEIQQQGKTSELVRFPSARDSQLGRLLDRTLPEEYIEELLQLTNDSNLSPEKSSQLNDKLKALLLDDELKNIQIPSQTNSSRESGEQYDESWWGGINNDDSCNQWIDLVEKILQGEPEGKALLLNIATPQSLSRLSVENGELGVLLAKEYSRFQPELIEFQRSEDNNQSAIEIAGDWFNKRKKEDPEILKKNFHQMRNFLKQFSPGKDLD